MTRWEPILVAGVGAAFASLDPFALGVTSLLVALKAGIGAAVGAYLGNHLGSRRRALKSK